MRMVKVGRGADQFPLRLPEGLRDRIREAADLRGTSMNAVIVKVLEDVFPEPWPLDARLKHLFDLLGALRKVRGHERALDALSNEIFDTVDGIARGKVPGVDEETQRKVRDHLSEWIQTRAEEEKQRRRWLDLDDSVDP